VQLSNSAWHRTLFVSFFLSSKIDFRIVAAVSHWFPFRRFSKGPTETFISSDIELWNFFKPGCLLTAGQLINCHTTAVLYVYSCNFTVDVT
jgi:hypothetical protein